MIVVSRDRRFEFTLFDVDLVRFGPALGLTGILEAKIIKVATAGAPLPDASLLRGGGGRRVRDGVRVIERRGVGGLDDSGVQVVL